MMSPWRWIRRAGWGRHTSGQWTEAEHLQSARDLEAQGDYLAASDFAGAAVNVDDTAATWVEYARLMTAAADAGQGDAGDLRNRAVWAAINGYLRAGSAPVRHNALVQLAVTLEQQGRGSDMVKALRLAQQIQPRDDTALMLEDAAGKYGFRVLETDVQANSARPRVCVNLSEDLAETGVDYAPFVQLPDAGMSVAPVAGASFASKGCSTASAISSPCAKACLPPMARFWRNRSRFRPMCATASPASASPAGPMCCRKPARPRCRWKR